MAFGTSKSMAEQADGEIDLKPFINFLIVMIPVLMLSADYASMAIINMKLPENRGSQTNSAVTERVEEENEGKLLLTMIVTDSVVTIMARGGMMPSLFYAEYHDYIAKDDRTNKVEFKLDPRDPTKRPMNPKTNKPFSTGERSDIRLYLTDENTNLIRCLYTKDGKMVTDGNGQIVTAVKPGETVYIVDNPRRPFVVQAADDLILKNLSAYDEMLNRLLQIRERFKDAADINDIIISAENQVAYDKVVQLMDIARSANFINLSIAKLRS